MQVANDLWSDGYHNLDDFRKKVSRKVSQESICQSCSSMCLVKHPVILNGNIVSTWIIS
jgi:hypothetical protein